MSWLTGLTGKAENFLNKLDKSAAEAFHTEDETTVPSAGAPLAPYHVGQFSQSSTGSKSGDVSSHLHDISSRVGLPVTASGSKPISATKLSTAGNTSGSSSSAGLNAKKKDSDEALFDFLNSKDPSDQGSKKRATPISSRHHSRQSSTSSLAGGSKTRVPDGSEEWENSAAGSSAAAVTTVPATTLAADPAAAVVVVHTLETQTSHRNSPTGSNESADVDALADAMKESPAASDHSGPSSDTNSGPDTRLSALELENRLLRNEVESLNQEMAAVIQRAKNAQTELVKAKEKLVEYTSSASLHDQLLRELRAQEADLQEAVKAKDTQLAVLRVRLEEAERDIKARQREVESMKTEQDRILHDQSSASGVHSQALDTMRQKLVEIEGALAREQQAHKMYQKETVERQSRLEQEQKSLAEALTAAEKKITEEKAKAAEAHGQLKTMKSTLESTRLEMTEYKEKASRILQSKERLIASMREGSTMSSSTDGVSSLEYDSVRQERDMLREELHKSKMALDNLRMEVQDLEVQLQQESGTAQDAIRTLEDSLADERRRREDAEHELLKQKQEQQYAIEELHRQKVTFQTRITDREAEIERLRNQLTTKSISSTSESELESRVRSLTESLIQKQTMLESLSTEKNSLTLQLERLGQQYKDVENTLMRTTIASVSAGDHDEDVRHRLPTFMREGVMDTEVTRRMKRYVNTIDKFSIRLGVFLRRYPIARIFVIVYMVMLHLWVMVVLMTYQPEIHGKNNGHPSMT